MATITGTIKTPQDAVAPFVTVRFYAQDTPQAISTGLIGTATVSVVTNASGAISLTLVAGTYTVAISAGDLSYGSFDILVPTGSGTYDLSGLIISEEAAASREFIVLVASDGSLRKLFITAVEGQYQAETAPYP